MARSFAVTRSYRARVPASAAAVVVRNLPRSSKYCPQVAQAEVRWSKVA
jgi:hypothetical protein